MELSEFTFDITTDEPSSVDNTNPFEDDSGETPEENKEGEDKDKPIAEVNPETIFVEESEDKPEKVGDEDNDTNQEDSSSEKKGSSSSVYSSIATALKEDGVLDLEDDDIKKIIEPEDFAEAIQKQVDKKLDETQQRIKQALDYGVEPDEIKSYEQTIAFLETIDDETLSDESEKGETLRKQILYQDFINKGYSEERATREVDKSIKAGEDLEDAKLALIDNKEYFKKSYQDSIKEAKDLVDKQKVMETEQLTKIKKSILETEEPFEGIKIDKLQRNKIYETLTKPVFKTQEGKMLTTIQKFESENPIEFKQKLATLFVLTDGFKKLDSVVKGKVQQATKKGLRELEHVIKNTPTYGSGRLNLANSYGDEESHKGLKLDIN